MLEPEATHSEAFSECVCVLVGFRSKNQPEGEMFSLTCRKKKQDVKFKRRQRADARKALVILGTCTWEDVHNLGTGNQTNGSSSNHTQIK